jgi:hypothetical protein
MKDSGKMTIQMARVKFCTQMEIFMKVNFCREINMARVSMCTVTAVCMMDHGVRIRRKAMGFSGI